jgi:hypothetical protein
MPRGTPDRRDYLLSPSHVGEDWRRGSESVCKRLMTRQLCHRFQRNQACHPLPLHPSPVPFWCPFWCPLSEPHSPPFRDPGTAVVPPWSQSPPPRRRESQPVVPPGFQKTAHTFTRLVWGRTSSSRSAEADAPSTRTVRVQGDRLAQHVAMIRIDHLMAPWSVRISARGLHPLANSMCNLATIHEPNPCQGPAPA